MTRKLLSSTFLATALSVGAAQAATTITINGGGSTLAYPTYNALAAAYNAKSPLVDFTYAGVGSGTGLTGFLTNNLAAYNADFGVAGKYYSTTGAEATGNIDYGASDAPLAQSGSTVAADVAAFNTAAYGPIIQIPTIGVPVTVTYNEPAVTGLALTSAQLAEIFSGAYTNWNQIKSTYPNQPITVVYRCDGSGTSFLFLQHLNAISTTSNTSPTYLATAGKFPPTTTFINDFSTTPPDFFPANGSSGVASKIGSTLGAIGYLSPDYTNTTLAPKSTNLTKTASYPNGLPVATVDGVSPTVANTELALANGGSTDQHTTPPTSLTAAENTANWVPLIGLPTKGYPIVGYTTIDFATCYANKTLGSAFIGFLTATFSSSDQAIITGNGFSPLSNTAAAPFAASIQKVFLNNTSGYNLNIDNATTCAGKSGR